MAIKRLHYFDNQFLVEADFTDEQKYHLDMRRRLNRALHTFGIAEGLEVVKKTNKIVTVRPGVAIDRLGREIILEADQDVDLSAIITAVPAFITIAYQEQQTDPSTATGAAGNTRFTEQPILQAVTTPPPTDGTVIRLASITLAAGGTVPGNINDAFDGGVRNFASSVIDRGSDLAVRSLALTDLSLPSNQWPSLRLGAANRADLTGSLRVSGDASVGGKVGIGTTTPNRNLTISQAGAITGVFENIKNNSHELLVGVDSVAIVSAMTASDLHLRTNNNTRVVVQANTGNVGIGTASPDTRLNITSDATNSQAVLAVSNSNADTRVGLWSGFGSGTNPPAILYTHDLRFGRNSAESFPTGATFVEAMRVTSSGNVGIGKANPSEKLDVVGSIRSTMWNVFTVLNQQPGALPLNRQFTSSGGTLLLFASGSGFLSAGGGQIGMEVVIDNVVRATARGFTNEALSHKAFTTSAVVAILIAAGQHNLLVRTMPNTVTDFNDFFTVTILELPWVQPLIFVPIVPIVINP